MVDIFYARENTFYEALVNQVDSGGFHYAYVNRESECGYVWFNDCLATWRPSTLNQSHLTPETLLLMYDSRHPAQEN
jgi:hypothetical protein